MRHLLALFTFPALLVGGYHRLEAQTPPYHLLQTFHIASDGGWDYLAIDPGTNHLFVSHGTQVNILDKRTGDSLGVIPHTIGVHGIAFVNDLGKGFVSNGRLDSVTVFDLRTFRVTGMIATGKDPDAIFYDDYSKKIITCNGHSSDLSIIDPKTGKVVATVPVGGKPETAVSDGAGKIYVNVETKSEIAVVNAKTFQVEAHWSMAPGESPSGLVIDRATRRLFAGCDNKLLIVLNADNGKVVAKLPIGDGCDGVGQDLSRNYVFASCGDGTLTLIRVAPHDNYTVAAMVSTKKGARTLTVDPVTHLVYLPTAEITPTPQAAGHHTRGRLVPGTFQVLVMGE